MPGNVRIEIPDEFTLKVVEAKLALPEFQIGQSDPKKTVRKPELSFEVAGDHITRIWAIRNPDKLRPWTAG